MTFADDLIDALGADSAVVALRELDARSLLTTIVPELEAGRGFVQPELHYYTVFEHNLAAVEAVEVASGDTAAGRELRAILGWLDFDESLEREIEGVPVRTLLRLACLVHDVAKPHTATEVEGRLRFPRHGPTGAELMQGRLPEAGFGPLATDFVARLVRNHLRPGVLMRPWPPTERAVRKFVSDLDGYVLPLMLLNLADGWATKGPGYTRENFRRHAEFVNLIVGRCVGVMEEAAEPLVTGDDLMAELDLRGGRLLGAVLTSVRRAEAEGRIASRDEALALARTLLPSLSAEYGNEPAERGDRGDS